MCLKSNETGFIKMFIFHLFINLYYLDQNDSLEKPYTFEDVVSSPDNNAGSLLMKLFSVCRLQSTE